MRERHLRQPSSPPHHVPRDERHCTARRCSSIRASLTRQSRRSRRSNPKQRADRSPHCGLRFARGCLRVEQRRLVEGLDDFLGLGEDLTRAIVTCPSYLPGDRRPRSPSSRSAIAKRQRRLAEEELELARAFGATRALGVAMRAAGMVAGGDRGALLLREAIDAFERGDAALGESACPSRPRCPAATAQSANRSARTASRGTRRRPPGGCQTARGVGRDRASGHRCAYTAGRTQRGSTR